MEDSLIDKENTIPDAAEITTFRTAASIFFLRHFVEGTLNQNRRGSPAPGAAGVEVNEVGLRVVTDSSAAQNQGRLLKLGQLDAPDPDIHRLTLHVQAAAGNPAAPTSQHGIGFRRPVGRDDLHGSGSAKPL